MENVVTVATVPPSFITMFDEAQKQLARQFNSFANFRKYAETIMGVASVIVSFFATFKVFENTAVKPETFYVLFILIGILYAFLMVLSIIVITPSTIQSPIKADLNKYNIAYGDMGEKEIISTQINLYVDAIQINEKSLIIKSRLSNIIGGCLCAIVILIFCAASVLIIQPKP
jgi:hypothetical protein